MSSTSNYRNYLNESLSYERETMSRLEYLKYGSLAVFLLVLIVLYVLEFPYFSNTFGVKKLVVLSLVFGGIAGVMMGYFFSRTAEDLTERIQIYVFFIILTMIFMPLLGSLSNRLLSFHGVATERVEFVQVEPFFTDRFGILRGEQVQPNAFHTFFYRENDLSYIRTKENIFPANQRGDRIEINTRQGFWGFDYAVINE